LSNNLCNHEQKIEIQVDFENNYIDFSDLPDHKNVNANHLTTYLLKEPYVFTFNIDKTSSITIETLELISSLNEYHWRRPIESDSFIGKKMRNAKLYWIVVYLCENCLSVFLNANYSAQFFLSFSAFAYNDLIR